MKTNIIALSISLVVGIILLGSLLAPAIDSAKSTKVLEQSEGSFTHYATTEFGHEYTFENGTIHYDGTDLGIATGDILSDKFKVVVYQGTVRLYDVTEPDRTYVATSLVVGSDGSYSFTTSDDTYEGSDKLTWFAGPADNGDYVAVDTTSTPQEIHFNKESHLYMCTDANMTNESSASLQTGYRLQNVSGTVSDLKTNGYIYDTNTWVEALGKLTLNYTSNSNGAYSYTTSNSNDWALGGYATNTNDIYLYAPLEYYVYEDNGTNSLLSAIPILVIVALLIGAVGAVVRNKD